MLTLFELRWSHYCEKVRLALYFLGKDFRSVGIHAFSKHELRDWVRPAHLPTFTVPALQDGPHAIMDSTPIMLWLSEWHDPDQRLFPGDQAMRDSITARLLEFDTVLAIPARRFGYSQLILECADVLPSLFLSHAGSFLLTLPVLRWFAGHFIGMVLCKRFDFHLSEDLALYEGLENWLLNLSVELRGRPYVIGDQFSAADLALAAQLRPLSIVPFFREHPQLQELFERQERVLATVSGEGAFLYQTAIASARKKRPPYRRGLRHAQAKTTFSAQNGVALNDQKRVWDWSMFLMPFRYRGIWRNKLRASEASESWR